MNAVAGSIIVEKRMGTDIEKDRDGSPTFFPADCTSERVLCFPQVVAINWGTNVPVHEPMGSFSI